jgi:UDP-N-acetylglucosamine/UDP-N-acetylgalactosamine diphosphorylase
VRTELENYLRPFGQEHLLRFWDELNESQQQALAKQIRDIDLAHLQRLFRGAGKSIDWRELALRAEPPPAIRLQAGGTDTDTARRLGEQALRSGQVGMILVAGGQGTRLGFDQPKGMFPIGPLSNRTLFEMHVDRLRAVMRRYKTSIPLYLMTSPATDRATREYFQAHNRLGLAENELVIFCQGTMPAVERETGKILLDSKDAIALSPDGHGGLVAALSRNGCLADAKSRGIEHFYYGQVDNPMIEVCDPLLIGYHIAAASQLTTQVVRKRFALEKVGNVVSIDGRVQIIEYSDLPNDLAEKKAKDRSSVFWAGNIAVHVLDRKFLEEVVAQVDRFPFHQAIKSVPYIDELGNRVTPSTVNAVKFERFVFDLLPIATNAIVVEADAANVFAPVKNASGSPTDSPETCRQALVNLHRNWLEQAGAIIGDEVIVEMHPLWALDAAEVAKKIARGTKVLSNTYFVESNS